MVDTPLAALLQAPPQAASQAPSQAGPRARTQTPGRVLFLALDAWGSEGGLQRFNRRVIAGLAAQARGEALLLGDRPADRQPRRALTCQGYGGNRAAFALGALARAPRARVLLLGHINLLPLGWAMRRLNPRLRCALFAHGIEVWGEAEWRAPRRFDAALLAGLDRIAAVSAHTAARMQAAHGPAPLPVMLFPNAVDMAPPAIRSAAGPPSLLLVSRMGPLDRAKHVDATIEAFGWLCAARSQGPGPLPRLEIVGDGPLRPGLEALAAAGPAAGQIRFHGRVDDARLASLRAAARAFVLPSTKEGFGIVYLEAWAAGLPVICGNAGAAPELVRHGIDGLVADPGDPAGLASAMAQLLDDPGLAARLGAAGRARVAGHYLQDHLEAHLGQLLEALS